MRHKPSRASASLRIAAIVGTIALLATGCATGPGDSKPDASAVDNGEYGEIRAMLPQKIRDSGVLSAITDPSHPPFEFMDDSDNVEGINADLAEAVADVLGLELRFETTDFAGLITGVSSKRYDVSIVAMFDTVERQEQVDFVDSYIDALKIIVPEGNPKKIVDIDDFCGRTISTLQGSVMLNLLEDYQPECGNKPMEITVAATTPEQLLWLETGRADASIANGTVTQYTIDQHGAKGIEVVHENVFLRNYYGWAIHKQNTELRDAIAAALNVLIEDGRYGKILAEWGATETNYVPEAIINGGGSL